MIFDGWRDVHIGFENDGLKIGGIEIWACKWRQVSMEALRLPHPAHQHQRHRFDVYEVNKAETTVQFAAG